MKLVSVETPEKSVCKMTFSASAEELEAASNAVYERTRATYTIKGFAKGEPVDVVIRPEDVQIVPPSVGMLTGLVREVIFKGVHFEMHVDVEGYEWIIHSTQASQPGELIGMNIGPDEIHIMKRSEV